MDLTKITVNLVDKEQFYNLSKVVNQHLDVLGLKMDAEAKFFLNFISSHAELKISREEYSLRSYRYPKGIPKMRQMLIGIKRNKRIETAYNKFASELFKHASDAEIITTHHLYLTLRGICPMWPFC